MEEKTFSDPIYPCSEETGQRFLRFYEQLAKERNMEEKKTKKMTKVEAFEYFKRKKILAEGEDANIGVQEKLFKCGIEWINGGRVPSYYSDYLIVGENGRLYHCGCDDRYWFAHFYESIDADDVLSIEIIEDKNNKFVDCSEPCLEIKAVQELLRNSNYLKDKIIVITKDNVAVL